MSMNIQQRHNFSTMGTSVAPPHLLEIQIESFKNFFQLETTPDKREEEGLWRVFKETFNDDADSKEEKKRICIKDSKHIFVLEFLDYFIDPPRYTIQECLERGITYSVPLKAKLKLTCNDPEHVDFQTIEQDVYLGNIPYMTPQGTFVFNGSERVIVSQLHRSPGVFFGRSVHTNGTPIYSARVIPHKGAWMEFAIDTNNIMYAYIDRKKKFPVTTLLRAIGYESDNDILELFDIAENIEVNRESLEANIGKKLAARVIRTWQEDQVDEASGEVQSIPRSEIVTDKDEKLTEENIEKILELGIEYISIQKENNTDFVIISNTLSKEDPMVIDRLSAAKFIFKQLRVTDAPDDESALKIIDKLFFSEKRYDLGIVGRYKINRKLKLEDLLKKESKKDAKKEQKNNIVSKTQHGHHKIKLQEITKRDLESQVLTRFDIIEIIKYLISLTNDVKDVDDIDHLSNRRVRTVGEHLYAQFGSGLARMARTIRDKMNVRDNEVFTPVELINSRALSSVINSFFGTSQLSQFLDQTNPLSEITHKRRISALGPGGLNRERAGFEVRDVHYSHYGRLCAIETPEGPNIGLISTLCVYAKIDDRGFITTPYRIVSDGKVDLDNNNLKYLSAEDEEDDKIDEIIKNIKNELKKIDNSKIKSDYKNELELLINYDEIQRTELNDEFINDINEENVFKIFGEERYVEKYDEYFKINIYKDVKKLEDIKKGIITPIVTFNEPINEKTGELDNEVVKCRYQSDFATLDISKAGYQEIGSNQIVGLSASLIPFLEHDDANRALMGSNMQRQAVPLILPETPIVGTGLEAIAAKDSNTQEIAKGDGEIIFVDAKEIKIKYYKSEQERLISFVDDIETIQLIKFRKTNQNTCINLRPSVTKGQKVKKGDFLTQGYAIKDGELALGRNLKVAFMPWKGYNFEDAIVISERVVREDWFTSIHIEEYELEVRETKLGPEELTNDIPNVSEEATKDLDLHGIIRLGAMVKEGDLLVGKITPKGETDPTPEEKLLLAIFGDKAANVKDASLKAPNGVEGVVINRQLFQRVNREKKNKDKGKIEKDRLEKDFKEKSTKIKEALLKKLLQLLSGKKSAGVKNKFEEVLIKKGDDFTEKKLKSIDDYLSVYPLNWTDDKKTNSYIVNLLHNYTIEYNKEYGRYRREKYNIEIGDELPTGVLKLAKVYIASKRKLKVGDKMAGRHGNKGIVAKIVRMEDMPFMEDGSPVDIVLNPLGVPSRMNLGQIYETILGWVGQKLDMKFASPIFDGASIDEIEELCKKAGIPINGHTYLYDGETGERFHQKVTVGVVYMIKLHHMVDDKMHARSIGSYSLITQQPLGGKAHFGGQRFGEMEVWALEAYGASHILQELLTIKSDDMIGRSRTYEAISKGDIIPKPNTPESFNVLVNELRGLGLDIKFLDQNNKVIY